MAAVFQSILLRGRRSGYKVVGAPMKPMVLYVLGLIASGAMVYGCVDSGLSAVQAYDSLGTPIENVVAKATAPVDRDLPNVREYKTKNGVRVVVIPDNPGCEIHYFVNASGIVSGYMFAGDQCTTYESDRFSEHVVIPTGSTVD